MKIYAKELKLMSGLPIYVKELNLGSGQVGAISMGPGIPLHKMCMAQFSKTLLLQQLMSKSSSVCQNTFLYVTWVNLKPQEKLQILDIMKTKTGVSQGPPRWHHLFIVTLASTKIGIHSLLTLISQRSAPFRVQQLEELMDRFFHSSFISGPILTIFVSKQLIF